MKQRWTPVLGGTSSDLASQAVVDIAEALAPLKPTDKPTAGEITSIELATPGLLDGDAGIAIFYHYLKRSVPGNHIADATQSYLASSIEALESQQTTPTLYDGFVGVAWAANHLVQRGESVQGVDPIEEIDRVVYDWLAQSTSPIPFDLLSGIVGAGVYALSRFPSSQAVATLSCAVGLLTRMATPQQVGVSWFTGPSHISPKGRVKLPNGVFNLGIPHGVAGVIAFLACVARLGIERSATERLVEQAVAWILTQERPSPSWLLSFPSVVTPDGQRLDSRLSWCYGDLSIASALLLAANLLDRKDLGERAIEIGLRLASANIEGSMAFRDPCVCHGTAGVAHMFARLAQRTDEDRFRIAARRWFERTLAVRQPGKAFAGFPTWQPDGFAPERGILTGAAGVGLALLAATTSCSPDWDAVLLLSSPELNETFMSSAGISNPRN